LSTIVAGVLRWKVKMTETAPPAARVAPDGAGYVLAIGAANIDIAGSACHALAPADSTPGRIRHAPGGVARNVAENLARLGHVVRLLCPVGDDLFGRSLLAQTRAAGVDVTGCWVLEGATTSSYLSLHGPDGDMAAAVNDMAIVEHITPRLLQAHALTLERARVVLLDGNLPGPALQWLFGRDVRAPVFVDPVSAFKCHRFLPWLGRIHTLKVNRVEAAALWGHPLDSEADVAAAAQWLHLRGVQQVVLSLGARGAYWSHIGGPRGWQPALPVSVVNATGAGDALMAGLVHGYLQGDDLSRALRFAAACAALTLTVVQANHPGLSVHVVDQTLLRSNEEFR
jgi:pseudouridine kinase